MLKRKKHEPIGEGCPFGLSSFSRTSMVYYSDTDNYEIPGLKRIVLDGEANAKNCTYGTKCKCIILHDPCLAVEGAEGMCVQINNGSNEAAGMEKYIWQFYQKNRLSRKKLNKYIENLRL